MCELCVRAVSVTPREVILSALHTVVGPYKTFFKQSV